MWLFFKKPATRRKSAPFKKELIAFACLIATFFLSLSLVSFHASDQTFLYYSTVPKPIHNWCGIAGAYAAAFILFIMGSAWVLAIFILLFIAYLLFNQRLLANEISRLFCCGLLLVSCSTLLWCSGWDPWYPAVPGGWCGFFFGQLLHRWCNPIGTVVIALMVACLCLMVITRVSLRFIVHAGYTMLVSAASSLYTFLRILIKPVFSSDKKSSASTSQNISFKGSSRESYSLNMADLLEPGVSEKKSSPKPASQPKATATPSVNAADADPTSYQMPSIDMFMGVNEEQYDHALMQELERRAILLQEKLERFDIYGKVTGIKRGPIITLFEYQPDIDTKISKIVALEDDLALALQTTSIRIMAPIPGTSLVGFEVANRQRRNVFLSTLVKTEHYMHTTATLPLLLGVDTIGLPVIIDLCKMPHLLMAGSTGSGKSVTLNAMIISLLCKASPDDVRLILIDPKRLEFAGYGDIAHLLFPIVTDPKQAAPVLRWVVKQMEERYALLAQAQARTIFDYRAKSEKEGHPPLPFIVVVIDELADLMMCAGKEIEDAIIRITQMARAAGIHMIAATQRPSVDVITGLIKVNFPSRVSFRVTSKVDSRTILDASGADKLLGKGDMLFLDASDAQLKRLHGAYVRDEEIAAIINHIRAQRAPQYLDLKQVCATPYDNEPIDSMFEQVCQYLHEIDEVSISLLQRRFRIGYNRSARIIELLESQGLISPSHGGKTRKVIR